MHMYLRNKVLTGMKLFAKTNIFSQTAPLRSIITGLVLGIYTVILCISFATLFGSDELSAYIPYIIGLYLIGVAVAMIVIALLSPHSFAIANPHNTYTAIMVVVTLHIANVLTAQGLTAQIFPTIFAAIAITSILVGVCFLILGFFRLGKLIRYIPYPVIGGFLASVGWVILDKAVLELTGHGLVIDIVLCVAMFLFAILALTLDYRYKNSIILVYLFVAAVIIFYLIIWVAHIPLITAAHTGWLMEPVKYHHLLQLPKIAFFANINWNVLIQVSDLIAVVIFVCVLTYFLNEISVEMETKEKIHFNNELLIAGTANIFSGSLGGVVAYTALPSVVLARSIGGTNPIVGLMGGIVCLISLFFGATYIDYLPKFALLGVLVFTAFGLLIRWLYQAYFRLNTQDYLTLITIFLIITLLGFVEGVIAGIILSMIFFVINYSKVNVIKYSLTGENLHSNKVRSPQLQKILQEHSETITYFKLQGYIFFGTAYKLLRQIRHAIYKSDIKYVILNFSLVDDLDSSAVQYFSQFEMLGRENHLTVILTNVNKFLLGKLKQENIINDQTVRVFSSADYALEWCEDNILQEIKLPREPLTFVEQMSEMISSRSNAELLLKYFTQVLVVKGECIIEQGDKAKGLYFIESGEVSVIFTHPETHLKSRLRKMGAGNIIGEIGLYTDSYRAASIIADESCVLYYLSAEKLNEMEQNESALAIVFHKLIINITAERLVYKDHQLEELEIA